jgi:signal transduction histidine kinase
MMFEPSIVAAIAAAGIGFAAYWSNPNRAINRVFFSSSLHVALWLLAIREIGESEDRLFWMRMAIAIGVFVPLHLWFLKESVLHSAEPFLSKLRRSWPWTVAISTLAMITFTAWFIPAHSTSTARIYGVGYYVFIGGTILVVAALLRQTLAEIQTRSGVSRLELQLLLLGGCAIAATILVLMAMRAFLSDEEAAKLQLQPVIILFFYSCTVIAITTHRIFDARQILLVGFQKFLLITVVAIFAFSTYVLLEVMVPQVVALLATTALGLWAAAGLSRWLDRLMHFYPQGDIARQAAFTAAQRENRVESLEAAFLAVLKGWGQTDRALILSGNKETLEGQGLVLPANAPILEALRQLIWVTPERLVRERPTPNRQALAEFLEEQKLGIAVTVQGLTHTVLIGVGIAASRRPFTYPQVTQLLELASIMEGALERAHFSAKVQHTEQLATVGLLGASLAHEIRNPLVSIKTFVQLLPTHHQDPVFRQKFFQLIGDEVGRIDQLTEQLLDLASPRTYSAELIQLHPVLRASLDLVAAKAAHKNVQFLTDFGASPDWAFTDASAAKQVMLNLCFNAIQAVESSTGDERWIKVATRTTEKGIEMAIADSGPGILAEIRPRLFQPFQTSKSTGFGLGLAICSDILANLHASISVDPPASGQGATFRVTFPCQPLSS